MKTLTRQANYSHFEGKFRVFFYQEAGAGFHVGNMLSMGHSDFESESQAQRAISEWLGTGYLKDAVEIRAKLQP